MFLSTRMSACIIGASLGFGAKRGIFGCYYPYPECVHHWCLSVQCIYTRRPGCPLLSPIVSWTYLLSPVVPDRLQLSWMSQIIPGCSSCPKSTPVVLCTWSSSIVPIHPQMCWTSMAVREVHASSAPHLVSARSGGYSVLLSPLYKCMHHRRLTWFRHVAGGYSVFLSTILKCVHHRRLTRFWHEAGNSRLLLSIS